MKKRLLTTVLSLVCILACAFAFAACDNEDPTIPNDSQEHKHVWSEEWQTNEFIHWRICMDENCDEVYEFDVHYFLYGSCVECGLKESHVHQWNEFWKHDDTHHWHECTALWCPIADDSQKDGYAEHSFENGVCICGQKDPCSPTQELGYRLNSDNASYSVTELTSAIVKNIVIPAEYNGKPVTGITNNAFSNRSQIESITIPDSITSIGYGVFDGCKNLRYNEYENAYYIGNDNNKYLALIKAKDTDIISCAIHEKTDIIADRAFSGCSSLESINVEIANEKYHSVGNCIIETENKTLVAGCKVSVIPTDGSVISIGNYAFENIRSLKSIIIPNVVTNIGYFAFSGCSSLMSVHIPDSVTSIGYWAFNDCASITSITISKSVKSIEAYTFSGCSSLKNINIPDNVTSIKGGAFSGCSSLMCITIPDSVASIGDYVFSDCPIETATMPASVVSYIPKTNLKTVVISSGKSIGNYAFWNYISLTSITIPDGVTNIGDSAFKGCAALESVSIPVGVQSLRENVFNDCKNLKTVNLGNVNRIYSHAFYNCSSLTSIELNYCYTVGESAFYGCTALSSVTIKNGSVTVSDYAFYGCRNLTVFDARNSFASIGAKAFGQCGMFSAAVGSASIGDNAFEDCRNLGAFVFMSNATSAVGSNVFKNCPKLIIYCTFSTQPNNWNDDWNSGNRPVIWNCIDASGNQNNDKDADGVIYAVTDDNIRYKIKDGSAIIISQLQMVEGDFVIPSEVSYKGNTYNVTAIDNYAFNYCNSLTSITIPDSVTNIGSYAFGGCPIETATIPAIACSSIRNSALKTVVITSGTSIESYALSNCSSLTSVTILNSVTSIGSHAFDYCNSLTSITIGSSVTQIDNYAFNNCSSLTSITFNGTIEQWNAIRKDRYWDLNTGNYTIHCTDGDIDKS